MGALADSLPYLLLESDSLALADGAAVTSWANAGWHGGAFTQATGASQPTYQTAETPTGEAALLFDGTDDSLSKLSTTTGFLRQTVMAVVKPGGSGDRTILGTGGSQGIILRVNASGLLEIKSGAAATYATGATVLPGTDYALLSGTFAFTHKATASSTSGVNWPENALDGVTGTGWVAAAAPSVGSPQWLEVELETTAAVSSINLTNATATTGPKDFTIQASNDGSTWTTLDTRVGLTWSGSTQTQVISYSNSTAYLFYRIHITATQGGGAPQIREFNLGISFTPAATVRVDGALDGSGVPSGTPNNNTEARIGSHVNTTTGNFNGPIAFLARWDRVLPPAELAAVEAEVTAKYIGVSGSVALTGVTANIAAAAVSGVLAAGLALTGATAGVAVAAPAGTVVAGDGSASVSLTGPAVGVVVSAPAGTVDAGAPVALTGPVVNMQVTAPTGVVSVGSFGVTLLAGGTITVDSIDLPTVVTLTDVTLSGGGMITVDGLTPITVLSDVVLMGGGTITARPDETLSADPRTGSPQWRYVVTDLDLTPLGELVDIEHGPVEDGIETPATMDFTIAATDPARALIRPIERQCQVWEGSRLLLRGPILPVSASDDGATMTYRVHDPSWYWRDGRRVIGRVPMTNLLTNGDFSKGLAGWVRGFDADSVPAAKPTVTIVDEDFSMDDDGLNPVKAAQIVGVESVTITETELQSSAVYYPNRPFAWEPLSAGFRPEGPAAIDAVANAMPATAGLKVTIVGHTANDGTGSGIELSKRRALAAKARVQAIRPGAVITTRGVGFYEPNPAYPIDSQQQRRVVISYESTTTIDANSKQWIRKTVTASQPKAAGYPLELTAQALLKVADDWSIEDANMLAIKVVARRQGSTLPWHEQYGVGSTSISDTDPVDRWIPETASVTIPPDGRTYEVDVYLYAAAALTRYALAGLFPDEMLYFWGKDQALIARGYMEHAQDPAMGKGDLGLTFRTPLTGIRRDRIHPHRMRMPIDTALEQLSALNRGLNIDVLTTPSETIFATFYPRQGQVLDYQLVQGSQIVQATPATTRDVGSSVIAQAQGLGSYRAEAYARDAARFGGLLLERVITAEQEAPVYELGETARAELDWAGVTTVAYWVTIDPARVDEVKANTSKGDSVRLIIDSPDTVDGLARIVKRQNHPQSPYRLLLALEA